MISRREFSQMLLAWQGSTIRWASCLLHASRTVNFPNREKTGYEGASHMMASLEWNIKRLLTWHLKRQMLQDHFTLNMCSVLALLPRQNFSLLSQPGKEFWLKFNCFKWTTSALAIAKASLSETSTLKARIDRKH